MIFRLVSRNTYRQIFLAATLVVTILVLTTGKTQAAPKYIANTIASPASPRQLCNAGTPVDFAVSPSNVDFNLTTGVLTYNINIQWQRCTGEETRAYAVYSNGPEICPYSGIYGAGGWTTDCVKYIGNPAYVGPGNGLTCWGGTNSQCITSIFSGARRVENQPSFGTNSISIPMSTSNSLWAFAPANGTWTVNQRMCQYYKTGNKYQIQNDNSRCVDVSIGINWATDVATNFSVTPKGQVNLLPDNESPINSEFTNVGATADRQVNGVNISRSYVIRRDSAPDQILPSPPPELSDIPAGPTGINLSPNPDPRSTPGLNAGDQVCVIVTASPGSGTVNASNTIVDRGADKSDTFCDRAINKPFVTFYGGDVNAGGSFEGGTCTSSGQIVTFTNTANLGSGVQFAAQAIGAISGFSSARGVAPPKNLTFANTDSSTYGGLFGGTHCVPDYFSGSSTISSVTSANAINLSTLTTGRRLYKTADVSMSGLIPQGVRTALYLEGNLHITNQIKYANNSWASLADIPSLHVYVKGNIYIEPGVTDITGFFVAQPDPLVPGSGKIVTCAKTDGSEFTTPELYAQCSNRLTIRGAIVAQKTRLLRTTDSLRSATTGSEISSSSSRAAEIFQYAPELYIVKPDDDSVYNTNNKSGYDYFTALPPIL